MKVYGEVLVFFLLLLINGRILFLRHAKKDSIVMIAPVCILLSILLISAWGVDVLTCFSLILSIIVTISNFHAISRYSANLYVDHYSPLMRIWAFITIVLSIVAIILSIIFAPIENKTKTPKVYESLVRFNGNFRTGFEEAPKNNFLKSDVYLSEFTIAPNIIARDIVVVVIPDKRGNLDTYHNYLEVLAQNGYTTYFAEFYASDAKWLRSFSDIKSLRKIVFILKSLFDESYIQREREYFTYLTGNECSQMINLLSEKCGPKCKYFFVGDGMSTVGVQNFAKLNSDKVIGCFAMESVSEYKTSGYGCIAQTDPLLSAYLGVHRDKNGKITELLVERTKSEIQKNLK